MDVFLLGPIPTPAVAMLTRSLRGDLGVMISASHNPYEDNGIKLFGPDGFKLSDEVELEIEAELARPLSEGLAEPAHIGRAKRIDDVQARYIEFVKASFPKNLRLDGLKIVIDCAHGAAYKVRADRALGAGRRRDPLGRRTQRLQHQPLCRLDGARRYVRGGARASAPISASPSTAMRTA